MGSWVTRVMGFPAANFLLATPLRSRHRVSQETADRQTDNGHQTSIVPHDRNSRGAGKQSATLHSVS